MKRNLLKTFKGTIAVAGVLLAGANTASAQVGIGIKVPDQSAMLQVFSDNRGVLFPSVQLQKANLAGVIKEPATGLLVWNTSLDVTEFADGPGYYYNSGDKQNEKWVKVKAGVENDEAGWLLNGNIVNATHYLGTNNAFPLVVKTNSAEAMRIDENQLVGIGVAPLVGQRVNVHGNVNVDSSYAIQGVRYVWNGGDNALGNTFLGVAGNNTVTGKNNVFAGLFAGALNTTGDENTFLGVSAGRQNITGRSNTFVGRSAGDFVGPNASANVFVGNLAGSMTKANNNVFVGSAAGRENTTGSANTFLGANAGNANETVAQNVFVGASAGSKSQFTSRNTFVGHAAGRNSLGEENTLIGYNALVSMQEGARNVTLGANISIPSANPTDNVLIGTDVKISGNSNTILGHSAGGTSVGSSNVYVGRWAGGSSENPGNPGTKGSNNTFVGSETGVLTPANTFTSATAIGSGALVPGSNTIQLGHIGAKVSIGDNNAAGAQANLDIAGTTIVGVKGTIIKNIITKSNFEVSFGSEIAGFSSVPKEFVVPNAVVGSTVHVSPEFDLAAGIVIAYARVISPGVVRVVFTNTTPVSSTAVDGGGMGGNQFISITVIEPVTQ